MDNTDNTDGAAGDDAADAGDGVPGKAGRDNGWTARRGDTGAGRLQRQVARRHRRDRIAGVVIAVLGVAVLIVAFLALRNPHQTATAAGSDTHRPSAPPTSVSQHPSTGTKSTSTAPSTSTTSSGVTGAQPLIVLNQTTTPDLAHQAAARFRSGGWTVTSTQEGYQNDVITTTAYYDPSVSGAQQAAQALARQYPTIHRVAARFTQLPAGPVVVVLTTDYSAG